MIVPGAIVRVQRHGDTAWVVTRQDFGGRWHVRAVAREGRDRGHVCSGLTAGEGDLILVRPAPSYERGQIVDRGDGVELVVLEDLGDRVRFNVPAARYQVRRRRPGHGPDHLQTPAGNLIEIPKADLVLEMLGSL